MDQLIDFFTQWPHQKLKDEFDLGLPLFWWARIGGIMQFLAGSFIIAEIIGFEKIRSVSHAVFMRSIAFTAIFFTIYICVAFYWAFSIYFYHADPYGPIGGILVIVLALTSIVLVVAISNMYRLMNHPNLKKNLEISSFILFVIGSVLQLSAA